MASFGTATISGQSLKTYQEVDSTTNKTTTFYLNSDFEVVGTKVVDADNGEEISIVKLPKTGGGFMETGSYKENSSATAFTWEYNFDSSDAFTGGTETNDGITRVINSDYSIASETLDTSSLTAVSDTSGIPAGAIASSGNVFSLVNDLGGGNKEIIYFDASGVETGYANVFDDSATSGFAGTTYFNNDDEWIGDSFTDGFLTRSSSISYASDGGYTETGTYKETTGGSSPTTLFESAYSYTFDNSGNLTSGQETIDGVTTVYGANWAIQSASIDVSNLTAADAGDDVPTSFMFSDKTYTKTETFSWGTETQYYSDSGALVGYGNSFSNTFTDPYRGKEVTATGKTYFDKDWNWVGDVFSDGYWSSSRFEVDNGNGTFTERGSESDETGWSRDWVFLFDSDRKLINGTETENGITTTFGADWEIVGRSADTSNLSSLKATDSLAAQASLDALPESFVLKDSSSNEYVLYKLNENPWGDETTYFDATGAILGYAFSWSDSYGSGTSYNDADWNYLGDTFTQGTYTSTRFETTNDDGTRTETGSEYDDGSLVRSWTFKFDSEYNLVEGTETFSDGVTTTYGANWKVLGESADTSALTAIADLDVIVDGTIKLSDLYNFTADVSGTATTAGYTSSKNSDWGDGTEVTYYNAAGGIVGRKNTFEFSFTDYMSGDERTQKGETYFDGDWNWIGDIFDDGQWSGSRFQFDVTGGGYREVGSEGDSSWTREFDFTFDKDGNLVSGTEVENGVTITYGANWEVTSKKADTSGLSTETTASVLNDLPDAFIISAGGSESALYSERSGPWGTERTYFNADGVIVGYSSSWTGPWGSGTNFNDADWNYLGDIFIESGGARKNVRFETENVDGTRTETGSEYIDGTLDRSWTFKFDNNYNLVEGTETYADGRTVTFGANWVILGEKADTSGLTSVTSTLGEEIAAGVSLDDMFDFETTDANGNTVKEGYSSTQKMDWNDKGTETTYYNADGAIVGRYNKIEKTPQEQDYVMPLTFFRAETTGGGHVDILGLGVDGLVPELSGSGMALILDDSGLASGETTPTTAAEFQALMTSFDFNDGLPSESPFGPGNEDWLEDLTGASKSGGVVTVTGLKGFVISGINTQSPSVNQVVNVDITSEDTLEYNYTWDGNSFFTETPLDTSVTISGTGVTTTDIIQASVDLVNSNPPADEQFFDKDWNFVGSVYSDSYFTDARFEIPKDGGGYTEFGFNGNDYDSMSFEFEFDANGNFLGGKEIDNGVEREVNEFGVVTKETVDASKLLSSTESEDLQGLPSSFVVDDSGTPTIFYVEDNFPGGTDTTYFTKDGTLLGNANSWSDSMGGVTGGYSSSGTSYHDANGEWIGDTFTDGTRTNSRLETKNADGTRTETGSEYDGSTLIRSWTYKFNDEDGSLVSGTETRADGTIVEFGANWTIISESLDLSAALASGDLTQLTVDQQNAVLTGDDPSKAVADGTVKLSDLYKFAADKNGDGDATDSDELLGYMSEKDFSYGSDVSKEITYYNAAGEIIGRANHNQFTFEDTWSGTTPTTKTQTSTFYNDADWNFIGDSSSDGTFSRKFFNVKVDASTKTEVGSEGDDNWSRDWVFNYDVDANGNESFSGGTETENGITYTLDANWSRSGGQADVSNLLVVTNVGDLPASFKFLFDHDGDEGTADVVSALRLQKYVDQQGNAEYEYFAADGTKLGSSNTFKDFWSGDTVINYNDADFNWMGETRYSGNPNSPTPGDTKESFSNTPPATTYAVTASDGKYYIDGVEAPELEMVEGATYRFDLSHSSLSSHPGAVGTAPDGDPDYNDGIVSSGTPGTSGAYLEVTVVDSAPTLYYFCTNHNGMGNKITTPVQNYDSRIKSEYDGSAWNEKESSIFIYDENWNLISGTEVRGGETIEYGANWTVLAAKVDVSGLTDITSTISTNLGNSAVKLSDLYDFVVDINGDGDTTDANETSAFSKTEYGDTIYYNGAGQEVGRSHTYDDGGTFSSTNYQDNNWNYLGDTVTDGTRKSSRFELEQQDGTFKEFFVETNGSFSRSHTYNFDADHLFTGGSETENGVTVQITAGPNGEFIRGASTVNPADLTVVSSAVDLAEIPTAFQFGDPAKAYKITKVNTWNTEHTYTDASGTEVGRAFENTHQGNTHIHFEDLTGAFLGNVSIETDSFKNVRFESEVKTGNVVTGYIETGSEYSWDGTAWALERSWIYNFDEDHNLTSGTEQNGNQSVTYGANWVITGSSYSGTTALQTLSEPLILDAVPSNWSTPLYYIEDQKDSNNSEWKFFDAASGGAEVGRADVYVDWGTRPQGDYRGPENAEFQFYTPTGDWIGNSYNSTDESGSYSSSYYEIPLVGGGTSNTYKSQTKDLFGNVIDEYASVSNYDALGNYTGGQFTTAGVTEFENADNVVTARNVAPDGIVTPDGTGVPQGKAGVVTEDGTLTASGVVSMSQTFDASDPLSTDASDTLSRVLAGGNNTSASESRVDASVYNSYIDGMFGTLFFSNNTGKYKYFLDDPQSPTDPNSLKDLNTGQSEFDAFSVIINDGIHNSYVDLQFEIEGNSENNPATTETGFLTFNERTKEYEVDITKITDLDGVPRSLGDFTFVWKIDGVVKNSATSDSYKPLYSENGKNISVEVGYSDGHANNNSESVSANTIIGVSNQAPVIEYALQNQTINEGRPFSEDLARTFSDADGNSLTLSASSLPSGMTLVESDGSYDLDWSNPIPGVYNITISASDGMESVSSSFELTVLGDPVNVDRLSSENTVEGGVASHEVFLSKTTTSEEIFDFGLFPDPISSNKATIGVDTGSIVFTNGVTLLSGQGVNTTDAIKVPSGVNYFEVQIAITPDGIAEFSENYELAVGDRKAVGTIDDPREEPSDVGLRLKTDGANDLTVSSSNGFVEHAELQMVTADGKEGYDFGNISLGSSFVTNQLNGLDTNSELNLQFAIDGMAYTDRPVSEEVTLLVSDKNSARDISVTFEVNMSGDGSSTQLLVPNQRDVQVSSTLADGSRGPSIFLDNFGADSLDLNFVGTHNSPGSLNLKLAKLIQDLDGIAPIEMLGRVGVYEVKLTGLDPFLSEKVGTNDQPMDFIKGTINVTDDTSTPVGNQFSLDLAGSDDLTVTSGSWTTKSNLSLLDDDSNGKKETLEFGTVVVGSSFVTQQLNGLEYNNSLKLSFALDDLADLDTTQTDQVTLTIRDSGGTHGQRDSGEREISVTFDVRASGNGSTAKIEVPDQNGVKVSYTTSDNQSPADLFLNNFDSDSIEFNSTGTAESPGSLNIKLANLVQDLAGHAPISMLGSVGKYEVELSGLEDFLYENDGGTNVAIENIRGMIEVVEDSFTPSFKDVTFSYTDPGNNAITVKPTLSTKNEGSDEFKSFSDAVNGDAKLHAQVFQDFGTGGYSMPTVGITLDTFIDTSGAPGGSTTETIRIRLIEGDDKEHGANERGIEAVFDIDRTGDGNSETWVAKAGNDIEISYANSGLGSPATVNLTNGENDSFVISGTSNSSSVSNSLELKLNDLLTKFESSSSLTVPRPQTGEDFYLSVSFIDEKQNEDIILAGDFSVI